MRKTVFYGWRAWPGSLGNVMPAQSRVTGKTGCHGAAGRIRRIVLKNAALGQLSPELATLSAPTGLPAVKPFTNAAPPSHQQVIPIPSPPLFRRFPRHIGIQLTAFHGLRRCGGHHLLYFVLMKNQQ